MKIGTHVFYTDARGNDYGALVTAVFPRTDGSHPAINLTYVDAGGASQSATSIPHHSQVMHGPDVTGMSMEDEALARVAWATEGKRPPAHWRA